MTYIIYIYIYIYNLENSAPSRMSTQSLCGTSCIWAYNVRYIYTHTHICTTDIISYYVIYHIYHIYVIFYICTFVNMHIYKHILISHATKLHNVAITLNTEHST